MARYKFTYDATGKSTTWQLGALSSDYINYGSEHANTITNPETGNPEVYHWAEGYTKKGSVLPRFSNPLFTTYQNIDDVGLTSGQLKIRVSAIGDSDVQSGTAFGDVNLYNTVIKSGKFGTFGPGPLVTPDQQKAIYGFACQYVFDDGVARNGVLILCNIPLYSPSADDIASQQFLWLELNFFESSDLQYPYGQDENEYPDGTPDGGYSDGTLNGDVSSDLDATPTHPIKSGFGVNAVWMTDAQLQDFTNRMWGRDDNVFKAIWEKWKNYKFNPMAGILTCHSLPTDFQPIFGGGVSGVSIAGVTVSTSCVAISNLIREVSFTQDMNQLKHYNTFLDYTHCRIIAHIPFCGICELPPDACIGGSVKFTYRVDTLNGNVACWVVCTDRFGYAHQIACLTGNCAYVVPITGNDNGMGDIIGSIKTGFNGALSFGSSNGVGYTNGIGYGGGNPTLSAGASGSGRVGVNSNINIGGMLLGLATSRYHTAVSGNVAGNVALLSNTHLFIEYHIASPSSPSYMQSIRGLPADIGGLVGDWAGQYVVFSDVHADSISGATDAEKLAIEEALKEGVHI